MFATRLEEELPPFLPMAMSDEDEDGDNFDDGSDDDDAGDEDGDDLDEEDLDKEDGFGGEEDN